ncbi:MAG: nitroreductase [Oligoflexia bacterium]|nr:nitroreductase [Oligoflexia bacterium]
MEYSKSVIELIKARISVRNYQTLSLPIETKKQIEDYILKQEQVTTVLGSKLRFRLLEDIEVKENGKIGTYGSISGGRYFIIGAAKNNDQRAALVDYGYVLEKIVLFLTDWGLGSCWLGLFEKSAFMQKFPLEKDEQTPAVCVFGFSKEKGIIEKQIRNFSRADKRLPWNNLFFRDTFDSPMSDHLCPEYQLPLEMLRLAPSAVNNQPWRVILIDNKFHFYMKNKMLFSFLGQFFLEHNLQFVDMGIALSHFELTANEMGLKGKWIFEKDPPSDKDSKKLVYIISWIILSSKNIS